MSEITLDIIKDIRERLNAIIADLNTKEDALKNPPTGAIEELDLPKETLDGLPWKLYQNKNGEWIFSNLENLVAQNLKDVLVKNHGRMKLHDVTYRFSGDGNKFISRYPKE